MVPIPLHRYETFDGLPYHELPPDRRKLELKKRIKGYAQKVYKQVKVTEHMSKLATVCLNKSGWMVLACTLVE